MGQNVVAIDFHKGFCIEFASTVSVVIASYLSLPVSSTHCQIGAVTFVGLAAYGYEKVRSKMLPFFFFLKHSQALPAHG